MDILSIFLQNKLAVTRMSPEINFLRIFKITFTFYLLIFNFSARNITLCRGQNIACGLPV